MYVSVSSKEGKKGKAGMCRGRQAGVKGEERCEQAGMWQAGEKRQVACEQAEKRREGIPLPIPLCVQKVRVCSARAAQCVQCSVSGGSQLANTIHFYSSSSATRGRIRISEESA